MILDRLSQFARYSKLHPGFAAAFEYLRRRDLAELELGRHALDGDRLAVILARDPGRGREGSPLESHCKYIDIQYVIHGTDVIGWRPLSDCRDVTLPYDASRDIGFFGDAPETWLTLPAGTFTIFWPDDAHAPLAGNEATHKAVMKIAVEW